MKYNDRIHYLGQTCVIGYLDKGGKWRKRDWYTKLTEDDKNRKIEQDCNFFFLHKIIQIYYYLNIYLEVKFEIELVKNDDEKRLRIALGLENPNFDNDHTKKLTKEEFQQV